mgnify:FL=1
MLDNTFIKCWIIPLSNVEKTFVKRWTIPLSNVRQHPCQALDKTLAKRLAILLPSVENTLARRYQTNVDPLYF